VPITPETSSKLECCPFAHSARIGSGVAGGGGVSRWELQGARGMFGEGSEVRRSPDSFHVQTQPNTPVNTNAHEHTNIHTDIHTHTCTTSPRQTRTRKRSHRSSQAPAQSHGYRYFWYNIGFQNTHDISSDMGRVALPVGGHIPSCSPLSIHSHRCLFRKMNV